MGERSPGRGVLGPLVVVAAVILAACDGAHAPPPAGGATTPPPEPARSDAAEAQAPAPSPAPAPRRPWIDVAIDGQAEWVAFRDPGVILVAQAALGAPLGIAALDLRQGDAPRAVEAPEGAGPPAAWSPAAGLLAFSTDAGVVVRRLDGGGEARVLAAPSPEGLAFSPAGDRLAVTRSEAGEAASVEVFDPRSGERLARAWPFGRRALGYDSGFLLVPAFVGGRDRLALLLANDTPSESTLALGGGGRSSAWRRVPLVEAEDDGRGGVAPSLGLALAVSPDGSTIAAGNLDARVHLLRADGDAPPVAVATGGDVVTALAFSPDGAWVVAAGQDGPLCALAVAERAVLARVDAPPRCRALAVSDDGRRVAGGCDGALRIWDVTW